MQFHSGPGNEIIQFHLQFFLPLKHVLRSRHRRVFLRMLRSRNRRACRRLLRSRNRRDCYRLLRSRNRRVCHRMLRARNRSACHRMLRVRNRRACRPVGRVCRAARNSRYGGVARGRNVVLHARFRTFPPLLVLLPLSRRFTCCMAFLALVDGARNMTEARK